MRRKSLAGGPRRPIMPFMEKVWPRETDWLAQDDDQLLAQCEVHTYKSSGPGGQHRNKVSSAVRLAHKPTGISAHGDDSRSQHQNKAMALHRLRMNIALQLRRPVAESITEDSIPPVVRECIFSPRGKQVAPLSRRLEVGRKDHRFWQVAQFLLDLLEARLGRLAEAADVLGITTSNLTSLLRDDRHLFAAAQELRKRHGQAPLK